MLLVEALGGAVLSSLPEHVANSEAFRYLSFPLFAAWIGGSSPLELKAAFLVLMLVFCWVSIVVERKVLLRYFAEVDSEIVSRCVKESNVASYALLALVTLLAFGVVS